jgi:hypothetical protein
MQVGLGLSHSLTRTRTNPNPNLTPCPCNAPSFSAQLEGKKRWRLYQSAQPDQALPRFSSKNFTQDELPEQVGREGGGDWGGEKRREEASLTTNL